MGAHIINLLEPWLLLLLVLAVAIGIDLSKMVRRTVARQDESIAVGKQLVANQERLIALLLEIRERLPRQDG